MTEAVVGLIGGSALSEAPFLEGPGEDRVVMTPHGTTSGPVHSGFYRGVRVLFLARHGRDHRIPPHRLNHRANLWALKELGATSILSTSSTGSLKATIRPGTFVVPDDFVSFWNVPTYFDDEVRHVTPAVDENLRSLLAKAIRAAGERGRNRGVYVQTTGPRLETRAEIALFRTVGDVLGMTMASEATLACELGVPYASLCSVDNYCNGIVERPLDYAQIRKTQAENATALRAIVQKALEAIP